MDFNSTFKIPYTDLDELKKFIVNRCTLNETPYPSIFDVKAFYKNSLCSEESIFDNFYEFLYLLANNRESRSVSINSLFLLDGDSVLGKIKDGKFNIKIKRSDRFDLQLKRLVNNVPAQKIQNFFVFYLIKKVLDNSDDFFLNKYPEFSSLSHLQRNIFKNKTIGIENFNRFHPPQDFDFFHKIPDLIAIMPQDKATALSNFYQLYNRRPQVFLFMHLYPYV